jgi:hypothetical protein
MSMGRLLRSVSTYCHAAPPPRMASGVVGEQERAGRAFAGLYVRKVFGADEPSQRLSDGEQKRVGATPAAHGVKLKRPLPGWSWRDPAECFVAFQETVERRQLVERIGCQRATFVPVHEAPEPFPQAPRLIRDPVELAGKGTRPHVPEYVTRN